MSPTPPTGDNRDRWLQWLRQIHDSTPIQMNSYTKFELIQLRPIENCQITRSFFLIQVRTNVELPYRSYGLVIDLTQLCRHNSQQRLSQICGI